MKTSEENQKRAGRTVITSVSVSKEFAKLIDQYNISPTECFRKGVAVTLFDLGVGMYQSQKNEDRAKYVKEFLERMDKDEKLQQQFEMMQKFDAIQHHLGSILRIAKEVGIEL